MTESIAPWRAMTDSVSPSAILAAGGPVDIVAGYPDFGWTDQDFARVGEQLHCRMLRITQRDPADWQRCSIFDYEKGALDDIGFRAAVEAREKFRPRTATVYCDLANLDHVEELLDGVFHWNWVADWPQYPTLAEVADIESHMKSGKLAAIQYRNVPRLDIDRSAVIAPDWHRKAA
jgi:hypothetical protein